MLINDAIRILIALREVHGNVDVVADCESCGHVTSVNVVVAEVQPKVRLRGKDATTT